MLTNDFVVFEPDLGKKVPSGSIDSPITMMDSGGEIDPNANREMKNNFFSTPCYDTTGFNYIPHLAFVFFTTMFKRRVAWIKSSLLL